MISGDLLSAAGLLLALIGLLYSVWYDEMNRALAVPIARHRLDREPAIATVRQALFTRAIPLVVAAVALVAVLADPAISVLAHAFSGGPYDAVKACFILVWLFCGGLTIATIQVTRALVVHFRRLTGPDLTRKTSSGGDDRTVPRQDFLARVDSRPRCEGF
jgi:hypothetical protein